PAAAVDVDVGAHRADGGRVEREAVVPRRPFQEQRRDVVPVMDVEVGVAGVGGGGQQPDRLDVVERDSGDAELHFDGAVDDKVPGGVVVLGEVEGVVSAGGIDARAG